MYTIEQGIIQKYNEPQSPRTCTVMQMPDRYLIQRVQLPFTVKWQDRPLPKSVILMAVYDNYSAVVLCVLRDPQDFLDQGEGIRGSNPADSNFLQPGEVQLEAAGDQAAGISGFGGTLHLANDGTVNLSSGKRKEFLILGGTDDDDDGEVLLVGDNGFFESNINPVTLVRSLYKFDQNNNLELGNSAVLVTPLAEIETPIAQLKIDTLGKVTLQNTTLGVPKAVLEFAVDGKITLKNNFGTNEISNTGAYSFTNPSSTITYSASGDIKLGNSIGGAMHIAPNGKVAIGSSTAELLDLFDQTLTAIIALTVGTGVGPSSPPLNSAAFSAIQTLLTTIRGTL